MRTHYAIATAVGAFLLGCAAAFAFITMRGPRSYDECMLDEMRGQPFGMVGNAVTVCKKAL
jgi:hypothetical protein